MTLHISISPEAEAKLRVRAAAGGQPLEQMAARLLEEAVQSPRLDEVLSTVQREFDMSGMTDAELGELLENAKHDLRRMRNGRKTA